MQKEDTDRHVTPRKVVQMPLNIYEKALKLQTKIQEKIGLEVTLGRVIERGIECLDDAYNRGAWLSPKEAAPRLERRIKERMMDLTEQLLAKVAPSRKLKKIDFQGGQIRVWLDDDKPIMLAKCAGGEKAAGAILT